MLNQDYLLNQYQSSANLNARIQLHERFSTNPINWHRWVFDQFQFPMGSRILELGSGSGILWLKNLERIPADWQITLSDFSAGMLDDARRALGGNAARFQFAVVDAQAIPFSEGAFDYVIANHMLYHVPDQARAFSEIHRVLAPQGRFYASTNGATYLSEIKTLCDRAGILPGCVLSAPGESTFHLQNGGEKMASWFSQIELRCLENSLAVTEAEPLVAFILASVPEDGLTEFSIQTLRELIAQELAEHGVIHISKEVGLFVAAGKGAKER